MFKNVDFGIKKASPLIILANVALEQLPSTDAPLYFN
jgi:hypothetical protein